MASDRVLGIKNPLHTVEDFFEGIFFVWMEASLIEYREQIPVMVESWI